MAVISALAALIATWSLMTYWQLAESLSAKARTEQRIVEHNSDDVVYSDPPLRDRFIR